MKCVLRSLLGAGGEKQWHMMFWTLTVTFVWICANLLPVFSHPSCILGETEAALCVANRRNTARAFFPLKSNMKNYLSLEVRRLLGSDACKPQGLEWGWADCIPNGLGMKGTLLQWRLEPVAVISLGNLMGDAQLGAYPLADEGRNVQTQITKWKWWVFLCMRFKYFFPSAWFWGSFLWIAKHFFKVSSVLVAVSLKETPLICTM